MDIGKGLTTKTNLFDPIKWHFQLGDLDDENIIELLDLWKQEHLVDDTIYDQIVKRIKNPRKGWRVRYYQAKWIFKWFWPLLLLIILSNWLTFVSAISLALFLAIPQVAMWMWGIIKFSGMFNLLCVASLEKKLRVGAFESE